MAAVSMSRTDQVERRDRERVQQNARVRDRVVESSVGFVGAFGIEPSDVPTAFMI